jgi:hypothetical protein
LTVRVGRALATAASPLCPAAAGVEDAGQSQTDDAPEMSRISSDEFERVMNRGGGGLEIAEPHLHGTVDPRDLLGTVVSGRRGIIRRPASRIDLVRIGGLR